MAGSTKTPTSTGERPPSILAEVTKAPSFGSTDQTYAPQFSFGRLSQNLTDSSKSRFPTTERPKSVLNEVRTPRSSSAIHESSQQSRFGPSTAPSPLQTRDRRDHTEGKVEAQAARINALETGFDVLKERYDKASGLVEKYEALLKTVEKEYADKIQTSEDNSKLALEEVVDNYIAQIKALEVEKETLNKSSVDGQKQNTILQKTNEEHVATISSLSNTNADLGKELESGLRIIESLKKKNESLTVEDQKWCELVDIIERDNKELCMKNSVLHLQNEKCLAVIRTLNETRLNLENELIGSFAILESLETENSLDEEKKEASGNLIRLSENESLTADDSLKEGDQAKQLEAMLSTVKESFGKNEEPSEKKVNLFHQSLRGFGLFLLACIMMVFVFWMISEARWSLGLDIDIKYTTFLLWDWISNLGNQLL